MTETVVWPGASYFAAVAWETCTPSFRSSPWIRGAPHSGLSYAIFRISARASEETRGRPVCRRLFHVQNSRNPVRCQATTVSGFTMTRAVRQPRQTCDNHAQSHRSALARRRRRDCERCSTCT